ncbi:hypothetical protein AC1031_017709 [Aphanomyces cochlioides]|nr:hypothetical protein AC1031_017709 [Aphanomyces cochlioides]
MSSKGKAKALTKKELAERLARLEAASVASVQAKNETSLPSTSEKKTVWTSDMVQELIELRLRTFDQSFRGSKSNQQLSILWEKIAMRLSVSAGVTVTHAAAKAKYHNLKQEYSRIRVSEQTTGNNVEISPIYPAYWDHVVEYLGDKRGLGHNEFGSSATVVDEEQPQDVENEIAGSESSASSKRHEKRRKTGSSSVANGLVQLGETLAKGLVDAAALGNGALRSSEKIDTLFETLEE